MREWSFYAGKADSIFSALHYKLLSEFEKNIECAAQLARYSIDVIVEESLLEGVSRYFRSRGFGVDFTGDGCTRISWRGENA